MCLEGPGGWEGSLTRNNIGRLGGIPVRFPGNYKECHGNVQMLKEYCRTLLSEIILEQILQVKLDTVMKTQVYTMV